MSFSGRTNFDEKSNVWSSGDSVLEVNRELGFGHLLLNQLNKLPGDYVIQINHNTGRKVTCSEMRLKATKFAEMLNTIGIRSEDNITIISAHHDDLVSVVIGASVVGAIINPLDPSFSTNEMVHFMKMTDPKLVVCDEATVGKMLQALQIIGNQSKVLVFGEVANVQSINDILVGYETTTFVPDRLSDLNNTALVLCSSGTTGLPKLVVISHLMATNGLRLWWSIKNDEIYFSSSNLYWLTSFGLITHSIMHRCPRIIVESNDAVTAKMILDVITQHKVNVTFVSPAIAMEMLKLLEQSADGASSMESVRIFASGGSFVSDHLVQSMSRFIPNGKMFSCYGMTEVSGLISTREVADRSGTIGRLGPGIEATIIDGDGRKLGADQSGEICIRHKLYEIKGYLNNESENRKAIDADKWFRTGDMGFFDTDHFLHLVDRKKEMLKYRNYQIAPTELEMYIQKHLSVDGVCVVGIDDEECGQLPAAVIVRKKSGTTVTKDVVIKLIEDNFSDSKRLRGGVHFVNAIPLTSNGKVNRKLVKQMIGREN